MSNLFKLLAVVAALSLPACSRDTLATESRAASSEASEFNKETSENSRTPEEVRDSAAAADKASRQRNSETPR
jgi:hypothetical protein